jgi:Mg/Co/Ni transporter MgtE
MESPSAPPELTPELLYLLSGDEDDFAAATADLRAVDIAEALNHLPVEAAARVVGALPFELAVQLFDEPELERRGDIVEQLQVSVAAPLVDALSADLHHRSCREHLAARDLAARSDDGARRHGRDRHRRRS